MKNLSSQAAILLLMLSNNALASDTIFERTAGWTIYSSVDRISDEVTCRAVSKQNLNVFAKTGVVAPVGQHMTGVEYRYDKEPPKYKSMTLDESKGSWAELSINYPTETSFFDGNIADFKEVRVSATHVFGGEKFSRYSLSGVGKALGALERCKTKFK